MTFYKSGLLKNKNSFFNFNDCFFLFSKDNFFFLFLEEVEDTYIKVELEENKDIFLYIEEELVTYENNLNDFKNFKFKILIKKIMGLSESRTESLRFYSYSNYDNGNWLILNFFVKSFLTENIKYKDKVLNNMSFLYLINSYRGWRHVFNLPSRGQRTKCNNKNAKNNKTLRNHLFNIFSDGLNHFHPSEVRNSFQLEQLNLYWSENWESEWRNACNKRRDIIKKSNKKIKFEVNTLIKVNPNYTRSKKQSIIPIGFEPGFTKYYLQEIKWVNL